MNIQILTAGRKKYVVLPEKDFLRLQKKAQKTHARPTAEDRRDATTLRRRLADIRRSP